MASQNSTLRQRGGYKEKKQMNGKADKTEEILDNVVQTSKAAVTSEWDYKLGLLTITILSFITRFWGISHPNEVVFDEVHFGKVRKAPFCPSHTESGPSSHPTIFSEPISSMSILPLESYFSP